MYWKKGQIMIKRKIISRLRDYYHSTNKALLLTGARQTGKSYQRHNALSNIMAGQSYNIREALVLSGANVKVVDRIKYLPIYMLMFLEKDKPIDIFVKVDLPTL